MNQLLAIVITVVVAIVIDHIRFNLQVNVFIDTANELAMMYDLVVNSLKENGPDVEFQGKYFYLYVKKGDYKSFVQQIELAVCTVLDKYDLIDNRYFIEMDNELATEIEVLHQSIENIQNEIRIVKWKNEWN